MGDEFDGDDRISIGDFQVREQAILYPVRGEDLSRGFVVAYSETPDRHDVYLDARHHMCLESGVLQQLATNTPTEYLRGVLRTLDSRFDTALYRSEHTSEGFLLALARARIRELENEAYRR